MRRPPAIAMLTIAGVLTGCGSSGETTVDSNDATDSSTASTATAPPAAVTGERITIGDNIALLWGDGPVGVVLAHGTAFDAASWERQASRIATAGATVLAVEDTSGGSIGAAAAYLRDELGAERVALIGGSSGADAILALEPHLSEPPDLLVLLSPNRTVEGLGSEPKLFVASEDEVVADVSTELAESSPGDDNVAMLLPGSAHAQNLFDSPHAEEVMTAILDRLAALGSSTG